MLHWERNEFEELIVLLNTQTITGPRGDQNYGDAKSFVAPDVFIEKITLPNINSGKVLIARDKSIAFNSASLQGIHHENVSGWKNPYLCI